MNKDEYYFWLCNIDGIGSRRIRQLINVFGSPENIYRAPLSDIYNIEGFGDKTIDNIKKSKNQDDIYKKLELMKKQEIEFYHVESEKYPDKLRCLDDKPYGIYVRGKLPDRDKIQVAIVGSRRSTAYGRENAHNIARLLAENGVEIISGMAAGIDSCGHYGALEGKGDTYAVLGCGADVCYPPQNIDLYMQIRQHGGIISEYASGVGPEKGFFPMRNRIISALSDMIIVIEAREKSGSLITVDQALEQGKDICALPGRICDPVSYGCNALIKNGAAIITKPEDVLNELHINFEQNFNNSKKSDNMLEKEEKMVYSCLDYFEAKNLEILTMESKVDPSKMIKILFNLELKGLIKQIAMNYYIRI